MDLPMANAYFLRKLAQDELWDTMFFASGERPIKEKASDSITLKTKPFESKIYSTRKIIVNGRRCNSTYEAKVYIVNNID